MTPDQNIQRLELLLTIGRPLPGDLALWLLEGVRGYLTTAGERSLDQTLGLARVGLESFHSRAIRAERDRHLRLAGSAIQGRTRHSRAKTLANEIVRYRRARRPYTGVLVPIDHAHQAVEGSGVRIPESPAGLVAYV